MTKIILSLLTFCIALLFSCGNSKTNTTEFQNGDIIFQTSESQQCEAVRIATNSKFSHCGIIFIENGKTYVYEAVQPVKITPFESWISHGRDSKYVVKRLKKSGTQLSEEQLSEMKKYGEKMLDKNYDIYFGWSNSEIYCSELVWKIYKNGANIELCNTKELKDFNLDNPIVQRIMYQRYGTQVPLHEKVVAPSQLHESELLETVYDNY
ncbi:MAG: YiiX family permuted papain-like enzyme [Bacteroidota bacterium]